MIVLYLFLCMQLLSSITCLETHLTQCQWSHIRSLLSNKAVTPVMREKVNTILFHKYHRLAKLKAYQYKKRNFSLCKNIQLDAFTSYAELGLYKSIITYNSSYIFYKHANLYISYYLYKGLSELYPMSNLPHRHRVSKTWRNKNTQLYNILMDPTIICDTNRFLLYNRDINNKDNKNDILLFNIWNIVHTFDPISIQIFTYKYEYSLKKNKTNKEVAALLCYSSEYIRQNLKKTTTRIHQQLLQGYQ